MPGEVNENGADARLSRRGLLKGAGISVAVSALQSPLGRAAELASDSTINAIGPGAVSIKLQVNGAVRPLRVEPRTTLADALRTQLDLTGTKVVCDRGACSACTVWLDEMPVCACMVLAVEAIDKRITTIEGLATGQTLHPVQEAFIEHDAMQCGFCTPGMIMSCAALLHRNPSPTREEVRQATRGNLCRCGTYPKVFDATLSAAKAMMAARAGA